MYVITNRKILPEESGLEIFGPTPNCQGANELRFVKVKKVNKDFSTELLDDILSEDEVQGLVKKHGLDIDTGLEWHASLGVACELYEQARDSGKHILVFVHGYNNDMRDVIDTARELESLYPLIVVPFSWPANGGGAVSGTLAYLSDKDDARASEGALHRAIKKISDYHSLLTQGLQARLWEKANREEPDNHENAHSLFAQYLAKHCKTTLNLLCHSMGNYVLKYAVTPSGSAVRELTFDNVCLVAADVNNSDHKTWVQHIPCRNRLYIVINENDWALRWSRIKPGERQQERLGHYLGNLNAGNAHYIDMTRNRSIGNDHSYFKGEAISDQVIKDAFSKMFQGQIAERSMNYHPEANVYRPVSPG